MDLVFPCPALGLILTSLACTSNRGSTNSMRGCEWVCLDRRLTISKIWQLLQEIWSFCSYLGVTQHGFMCLSCQINRCLDSGTAVRWWLFKISWRPEPTIILNARVLTIDISLKDVTTLLDSFSAYGFIKPVNTVHTVHTYFDSADWLQICIQKSSNNWAENVHLESVAIKGREMVCGRRKKKLYFILKAKWKMSISSGLRRGQTMSS